MNIETKRLIIRNFELTDESDLREYMLQRVHALYEAYPDFTADKSKKEIAFRSKSDEFLAIELTEEHKVIGNIYMGKRNYNTRELGYVLNELYQHRGFGSEAAAAVLEYFFTQSVHRVYAECCPQNTPSWKTMEKIGMNREAHFRKNVSFRTDAEGKPVYWDTYVYAVLNPRD
jgi:[ribosomal protein S5]-alanine N-acetyltransferase